ncbi:hypothetical protein Zmor_001522 [Zophobas morio]|uniref:Kazal-like domain-containing protein n=1 Tax=Zophobas morio TaxID=2755281 RepID=A0AA38MSP8_9CUCU|nr:hypothetical protein Zmor_001522 [Zophobas morio]
MKTLTIILFAAFVIASSAVPSRVRRQGFNWEDYDDRLDSSTQRQSQAVTPTSGSGGVTTTTTASPQYTTCIRRCPVTPQYNPICGTNRITYNNESHLRCAQQCGLSVQRAFGGSCQAL